MRRNEFNRLLEQTFADEPIFDLAASQSTYPDGRREFFQQDGQSHYSLIAGYTDDGGHLNAVGRRHVAADFVHAVADALRVRNAEALAAG
jgi:lysophospholipase L1-like esterase